MASIAEPLTNRYVNYLDESDFDKKETRNILKALREWWS